jgi:hypothetical protein
MVSAVLLKNSNQKIEHVFAGGDILVLELVGELLLRHVSNISCETGKGGGVEVLLNVTGGERLLFP